MKRFIVLAILATTTSAFARSYEYSCYSFYWNGEEGRSGTMELSVNPKFAKGEILGSSYDVVSGKIDNSYRSRGNRPNVKFGKELIVEKSLISGGRRLRDGHWGGVARVVGQDYEYRFICKLK